MEEKLNFYENYYIPLLKKRVSDVSASIPEIEAALMLFKEKCAKLESENRLLIDRVNSMTVQSSSEYK